MDAKIFKAKSKPDRSLYKEAWHLGWPSIIEFVFIQLASLIDSMMVSSLGESAIAAISLTIQPIALRLAPYTAMNIAAAALIARRRGEQRRDSANQVMVTAFVTHLVMALVLSVGFIALANPLMRLCGSNSDTHEMAVRYFRIVSLGTLFTGTQAVLNSSLRAAGKPKVTMVSHLLSNSVNIVGNYLLINGHLGFPALGITGAAIATVFGLFVSSLVCIIALFDKDSYLNIHYIFQEKIKPRFRVLKRICQLAVSVFIEQILLRVGFLLTQRIVAKLGTRQLAAYQACINVLNLAAGIGEGLKAAIVALVGKSLGEQNQDRIEGFIRVFRVLSLVASGILTMVYIFLRGPIFSIYFDQKETLDICMNLALLMIPTSALDIFQLIYSGCLHTAGDMIYCSTCNIISILIIRPLAALLFANVLGLGVYGVWIALMTDHLARYLFYKFRVRSNKWLQIKI